MPTAPNTQIRIKRGLSPLFAGLVISAMDYAMAKVLNRLAIPLSEDRRKALESAEDLFSRIARGDITPESFSVDGGGYRVRHDCHSKLPQ